MKIYTRTGDKGMTRLVGGSQVSKDSDRVESYGTVDELNSWIGYTISQLDDKDQAVKEELKVIQNFLFDIGTDLATPPEANRPTKIPDNAVKWLEDCVDKYTEEAPDIQRFILPGGTQGASMLHVARTIARRAERSIVRLSWTATLNENVVMFVNRLSDYFYALARALNARSGEADIFYERGEEVFHKIKQDGL